MSRDGHKTRNLQKKCVCKQRIVLQYKHVCDTQVSIQGRVCSFFPSENYYRFDFQTGSQNNEMTRNT